MQCVPLLQTASPMRPLSAFLQGSAIRSPGQNQVFWVAYIAMRNALSKAVAFKKNLKY